MGTPSPASNLPTLADGTPIPRLIYGTARRTSKNPPDVLGALMKGYRAVDTVSSRLFHREDKDGEAVAQFLCENTTMSRNEIFLISKYAPPAEQAGPWPYDVRDDVTTQVLKSVLRSVTDFQVEFIDAYLLHAPYRSLEQTLEAWRALELIMDRGGVRYIGVANIREPVLAALWEQAHHKPAFVQNWFREATAYDREVVKFCRDHSITYQIFGVFDEANAVMLRSVPVQTWADQRQITPYQALLSLLLATAAAQGLRLCILDGATSSEHMNENLQAAEIALNGSEECVASFSQLIGWT